MEFRKLELNDIDFVLEIESKEYSHPWTKKMFLDDLSNQYAHNFVLVDNSKIIGYFGVWIINDYATVTKVTVNKENQGKHLGDLVFNKLISLCEKENCSCIDLEVDEDNIKAISLYKKNDFEITRIIKDYYGQGKDALNMVKILKKEGKSYEKIHISN